MRFLHLLAAVFQFLFHKIPLIRIQRFVIQPVAQLAAFHVRGRSRAGEQAPEEAKAFQKFENPFILSVFQEISQPEHTFFPQIPLRAEQDNN